MSTKKKKKKERERKKRNKKLTRKIKNGGKWHARCC